MKSALALGVGRTSTTVSKATHEIKVFIGVAPLGVRTSERQRAVAARRFRAGGTGARDQRRIKNWRVRIVSCWAGPSGSGLLAEASHAEADTFITVERIVFAFPSPSARAAISGPAESDS